jgi:hypothetical protein
MEQLGNALGLLSSRSDYPRLLNFCVTVFDRLGPKGAVLFRTVDPRLLTPDDIAHLGSRLNWVYCFMRSDSIVSSIVECLGGHNRIEARLNKQERDLCEVGKLHETDLNRSLTAAFPRRFSVLLRGLWVFVADFH